MDSSKVLVGSRKCIECGKRCWPWQKWHPVNVIQAEHSRHDSPKKKVKVLVKSANDIAFEKQAKELVEMVRRGEVEYDSTFYLYTTEDDYTFVAVGGMLPTPSGDSLMRALEYF